ncbi:DUF833-domain-containing protein [Auricularia subglabra TFB-10046 SS5]|nr:DUF833-domain-containing protein [Auricularia subglabra TFB-10046 SS5]
MCIAVWSLEHPDYALVLGANRDEFLARPTEPAHFHAFGAPGDSVLAGRDVRAGGTWLGINRLGRIAALTNIREDPGRYTTSRGELASSFLMERAARTADEHLADLAARPETYAGFNLLLFAPGQFGTDGEVTYEAFLASNLGGGQPIVYRSLREEERKCGGISNGADGSETWPKVADAQQCLISALEGVQRDQSPEEQDTQLVNSMFLLLSKEHNQPLKRREDLRRTIQVPLINLEGVPNLNGPAGSAISSEERRALWYGTRLATVILVRRNGSVLFVERDIYRLDQRGEPCNGSLLDGGHDRVYSFDVERSV